MVREKNIQEDERKREERVFIKNIIDVGAKTGKPIKTSFRSVSVQSR